LVLKVANITNLINFMFFLSLQMPSTPKEWLTVVKGYEVQWDFPYSLGLIDCRLCMLQAPASSGSDYCNYNSDFSTVLPALADCLFYWCWMPR
jgi:hypothetical protein